MKTSIIISSCDLYSDCGLSMIHSFQKFWKDCLYEVCIISNYEKLDEDGIRFIPIGELNYMLHTQVIKQVHTTKV